VVELWRRCLHAGTRSSHCHDSVGCITATWAPLDRSGNTFTSDLRRSPGRIMSSIAFRTQVVAMPHAILLRFKLTGRPAPGHSDPEELRHDVLSFGEPHAATIPVPASPKS
jgi:hypothetical protein